MASPDLSCFELIRTLEINDISVSTYYSNDEKEIVSLLTKYGDIILYSLEKRCYKPALRWVPWTEDVEKKITTIAFEPGGTGMILIACLDLSLYLISTNGSFNNDSTSENDIERIPSPISQDKSFIPSALAWWAMPGCVEPSRHVAIVGSTTGHIMAFTIFSGNIIFVTLVEGCITNIQVSSSLETSVIVTNESGKQWRFSIIEQSPNTSQLEKKLETAIDRDLAKPGKSSDIDFVEPKKPATKRSRNQILDEKSEEIISWQTSKLFIKLYLTSEEYSLRTHDNFLSGTYQSDLIIIEHPRMDATTIHKIPEKLSQLVITKSFLIFTNLLRNKVIIISKHLSQCKTDAAKNTISTEFHSESLIQELLFEKDEYISNLFCTQYADEHCCIITNLGIYTLKIRCRPRHLVLKTILSGQNLQIGEKISKIFGLDLQALICEAADIQLSKGLTAEADRLYSLSKCGSIHHILMLATKGHIPELMDALKTFKCSNLNKYHVTNLKLFVLIHKHLTSFSSEMSDDFKHLLLSNDYDQTLAINIMAKADMYKELKYLMKAKGLQHSVLLVVMTIVQNRSSFDVLRNVNFWNLITEPSLYEALLCKPNLATYHCMLMQKNLKYLNLPIIMGDIPIEIWIETYLIIAMHLSSSSKILEPLHEISKNHLWDYKIAKEPTNYKSLAAGYKHAFAICNGNGYGWGNTIFGILGVGPSNQPTSDPKLLDTFLSLRKRVLSITCGRLHTFALTNNGVYSWGSNKYGQLGLGSDIVQSSYPQLISALSDQYIIQIASGQYHCIAINDQHEVFTWGWGVHGQLGHGDVEDYFKPKLVNQLSSLKIINCAAGLAHSLFLDTTGNVWACGSNAFGQLGIGQAKKSSIPIKITAIGESLIQISAGYFQNCVLSVGGKLYQWGRSPNTFRLAVHSAKKSARNEESRSDSRGASDYLLPKLVDTSAINDTIIKVSVGSEHSILLTSSGRLYSWGRNVDGELGIQATPAERKSQHIFVPTPITLNARIKDICCGWDFTIATDFSGNVWTWGANHYAKPIKGTLAGLEGEIVVVNNKNRVLKFPHSSGNINAVPIVLTLPKDKVLIVPAYTPPKLPAFLDHGNWRKRVYFALETLGDYYDINNLFVQCKIYKESDIFLKVAQLTGNLSEALIERFKFVKTEEDIIKIMQYYFKYSTISNEEMENLAQNIIQLWNDRNWPFSNLEKLLLTYWTNLAVPIGTVLFRQSKGMEHCLTKFSTNFMFNIVEKVCMERKNNYDCIMDGFTDIDVFLDALESPSDFIDIASESANSASKLKKKVFYKV